MRAAPKNQCAPLARVWPAITTLPEKTLTAPPTRPRLQLLPQAADTSLTGAITARDSGSVEGATYRSASAAHGARSWLTKSNRMECLTASGAVTERARLGLRRRRRKTRRQKAESRKQKAEGSRQKAG